MAILHNYTHEHLCHLHVRYHQEVAEQDGGGVHTPYPGTGPMLLLAAR